MVVTEAMPMTSVVSATTVKRGCPPEGAKGESKVVSHVIQKGHDDVVSHASHVLLDALLSSCFDVAKSFRCLDQRFRGRQSLHPQPLGSSCNVICDLLVHFMLDVATSESQAEHAANSSNRHQLGTAVPSRSAIAIPSAHRCHTGD